MSDHSETTSEEENSEAFCYGLEGDDQTLTSEQIAVLSQLPQKTGYYWVQDINTDRERPVSIAVEKCTSANCDDYVICDEGCHYCASDPNISTVKRWLSVNIILGPIAPFQHPPKPAHFGLF